MENRFKPGDIVQHFKREMLNEEERAANKYLYEIVGIATHSETREPMMVYRPLYDDGGMDYAYEKGEYKLTTIKN